jgi:hypothetical protein
MGAAANGPRSIGGKGDTALIACPVAPALGIYLLIFHRRPARSLHGLHLHFVDVPPPTTT